MITVVKKDIGKDYFKIDSMYRQVWGHPTFSLMRASQAEVSRMRSDGSIGNDVVEIMRFLNDAKFATADQIERGTGIKVSDKVMGGLYDNLFVNKFVLSELDDPEAINDKEALIIYTLDFGGDYLLSIENVNMTNWRYTQYFASAQLIAKALQQVELLIAIKQLQGHTLREYGQFKELRASDKLLKLDFDFSILKNKTQEVTNFIGFFLEPGFEDLNFRDSADVVNFIFNVTNSWLRYYPLGQDAKPKLMLIVRDVTDKGQLDRTAKVVAQATDYAGLDLCIIGYNDLLENGLDSATLLSIQTTEQDGVKDYQMGRLPMIFSAQ